MARPFLEERISLDARYGTSFEKEFAVDVEDDVGGNSYSHLRHPYPRVSYELNFANCLQDGLARELQDLYMRSGGMHGGFRVRDYTDYSTNNYTGVPTHLDQSLINLGGNKYQLVRWYGPVAPETPRRLIRKPVAGTVVIGVGGVEVVTGFSVDYTTGIVTFSSAPSGAVTGGCEYDIPVSFATKLSGNITSYRVISSNISVREIFNP